MTQPRRHYFETKKLLKSVNHEDIGNWLLKCGYYPEKYVLPPSFNSRAFEKTAAAFYENTDFRTTGKAFEKLLCIEYPKSAILNRNFAVQHPYHYHDLVHWILDDWDNLVEHLFHSDQQIYSYSFPIPVGCDELGQSSIRAGRMIYEWIEMAENDLVAEAPKFNFLVRTDITNFYNSIYTHSIGWALHGRRTAFEDRNKILTGNKLDRLVQYANEARTNGLPVGSALSDLIAEFILSKVDLETSKELETKKINFLGTRYKDDYRFLCGTEEDAKTIIQILSAQLSEFNLLINESKTKILNEFPNSFYRLHSHEYSQYSLKNFEQIDFEQFEIVLLKALNIHRKYPGTSLLEKFLCELFNKNNNYKLKISFSSKNAKKRKQIVKAISLLLMLKRESPKTLCHVLAIFECLFDEYDDEVGVREILEEVIESELKRADSRNSVFEVNWFLFFSKYMKIADTDYSMIKELSNNGFVLSLINDSQNIFPTCGIKLFEPVVKTDTVILARRLDIFESHE